MLESNVINRTLIKSRPSSSCQGRRNNSAALALLLFWSACFNFFRGSRRASLFTRRVGSAEPPSAVLPTVPSYSLSRGGLNWSRLVRSVRVPYGTQLLVHTNRIALPIERILPFAHVEFVDKGLRQISMWSVYMKDISDIWHPSRHANISRRNATAQVLAVVLRKRIKQSFLLDVTLLNRRSSLAHTCFGCRCQSCERLARTLTVSSVRPPRFSSRRQPVS
jgi:hypothetical protein